MKLLENKKEIAMEINIKRTTVVRIDLAESDEYGLKSQKILIDNGYYNNDAPYLIKAEIRAYKDEMKFVFSGFPKCLKRGFDYYDMEEMLEYANAPIIKKDSEVILAIVNSKTKQLFKPIVMHTSNMIYPHSTEPLTFIDEDNSASPYIEYID